MLAAERLERQRRQAEQIRLTERLVEPKEFLNAMQRKQYTRILKFFEHFANDHYSLTKPIIARSEEIMQTLMDHSSTPLIRDLNFLKCLNAILAHINFERIPDFWLLVLHTSLNPNKTEANKKKEVFKETTNEKPETNKASPAETYMKLLTICHDRLKKQMGDHCCEAEKEHNRKMKVLRTMR